MILKYFLVTQKLHNHYCENISIRHGRLTLLNANKSSNDVFIPVSTLNAWMFDKTYYMANSYLFTPVSFRKLVRKQKWIKNYKNRPHSIIVINLYVSCECILLIGGGGVNISYLPVTILFLIWLIMMVFKNVYTQNTRWFTHIVY